MLSKSDFSECLFYPAAGTDLQPLLRFSHMCSTFVCPNVSSTYTPEKYVKVIDQKLKRLNHWSSGILERVYEVEPLTINDLDYSDHRNVPASVFSTSNQMEYMKAFKVHMDPSKWWGIKLKFIRRIGNIERKINWFVFTGEGLASYQALSHAGQYPCKIFITVQSGLLEKPQGILERLFETHEKMPQFWLRGKWKLNKNDRSLQYGLGNSSKFSFASEAGRWNRKVQSYPAWNSNMGEKGRWGEENDNGSSIVIAFSNQDLKLQNKCVFKSHKTNKEIKLCKSEIIETDFKNYDAVFLTKNLLDRFSQKYKNLEHVNFFLFDKKNMSLDCGPMPDNIMYEALIWLDNICKEREWKKVLINPVGFEDEGQALMQFLDTDGYIQQLTVKYTDEWDFADLR